MTEDVYLRDAREDDADFIRNVTLSAYQEYAAAMPAPYWEAYRRNIVQTLADVGRAEQIVAQQNAAVVGTVLLYPTGTEFSGGEGATVSLRWPELRLLAVAPEVRGQGIGAALVRECIRRAQASGAPALTLHTTDMMHVARAMYERMGFVRAPGLDFSVGEGTVIKGYRLDLTDGPLPTANAGE